MKNPILSASGQESPAVDDLCNRAENGDSIAQAKLALHYEKGIGGRAKNEAEAIRWLRKAAEQASDEQLNPLAQAKLGSCYLTGHMVEKDARKAFEWTKKSAENGWFGAQITLGNHYRNGDQVAKDKVRALMWFIVAEVNDLTPNARRNVEGLTKEMTKNEISEARRLSSEWLKKKGMRSRRRR